MSKLPKPSPQGEAIIEAWNSTKKSLMIIAYAGTGKTTTLRQLAPHITERAVLSLAFNKKNAEDLAKVMPAHFTCSTLNSQGHRALQRAHARRLQLESDKNTQIIKTLAEEWGLGRLDEDTFRLMSGLMRSAKSKGLMPSQFTSFKSLVPDTQEHWEALFDEEEAEFNPEVLNFVRQALIINVNKATKEGIIDYDDQIYISTLAIGAYERFPVVMVDEAQDLSPLNHLQIKKCLALNGRYIVVGDPKQAIYAFRGASSQSMPEIESLLPEGSFIKLPLSVTYRCSKLVVERNVAHAPGFEAHSSCHAGVLVDLRHKETWDLDDVPDNRFAILCRNNAPLLSAAFRIIKSGRGVTMLGRDLGKTLIAFLHKVVGKNSLPLDETVEKIRKWLDKERELLILNGKESQVASIEDRAMCLLAVAEGSGAMNSKEMEQKILDLFEDRSGLIVLGTGHRAKGLEWDTVVHLDPWRIPSKWARDADENGYPEQLVQENNLKYVIETRAKVNLVLGNSKGFLS